MERICISFNIKQGSKEEYVRRHNEIWPELVDLMIQYGFSNQTIFINDTTVIAYLECDGDYLEQAEKFGKEQISIAWQEYFDDIIIDSIEDGISTRYVSFEEVWHLE